MFSAQPPANQYQSEVPTSGMLHYPGEDPAVTRFRELLSIRTISLKSLDAPGPQPDYCGFHFFGDRELILLTYIITMHCSSDGVVRFLEREAKEIGLPFKCFEVCGLARTLSVHKLSMC